MSRYVTYLRVSTDKQGHEGLGIEAQQAAIAGFLRPDDTVIGEYREVESGRKSARPQLARAIAKCRKTGAALLVSKLDRLTRNQPFLRSLLDSGLEVSFGDLPQQTRGAMGRYFINQMALIAELEAGLISERTKAALAAAKARGVKLGGDRGYRPESAPTAFQRGSEAAAVARSNRATQAAYDLAGVITELQASGVSSLNAIAAVLNERGTATPGGNGQWTATAVRRVLARLEQAGAD
jgi:DNA invertase Pin-like site-specific DNA recombinase